MNPAKANSCFLPTEASFPKHRAQQLGEGLGWVFPSDPCMDVGAAAIPGVSGEAALCGGGLGDAGEEAVACTWLYWEGGMALSAYKQSSRYFAGLQEQTL